MDPKQKELAFQFACHYDLFGLEADRALFATVRPEERYRVGCDTVLTERTSVELDICNNELAHRIHALWRDRLTVLLKGPGTWPRMGCSAVYVLKGESEFSRF
jgi:hypothetical protein